MAKPASDAFAAAGWPVVGGIGGDDVAKPASDAFAAAGWPVLAGILVEPGNRTLASYPSTCWKCVA